MNGCVPLPVWVTRKIEHFWGFCCSTIRGKCIIATSAWCFTGPLNSYPLSNGCFPFMMQINAPASAIKTIEYLYVHLHPLTQPLRATQKSEVDESEVSEVTCTSVVSQVIRLTRPLLTLVTGASLDRHICHLLLVVGDASTRLRC